MVVISVDQRGRNLWLELIKAKRGKTCKRQKRRENVWLMQSPGKICNCWIAWEKSYWWKMRINKKPVKSARNLIEREGVKTSFTGLLALLSLIGWKQSACVPPLCDTSNAFFFKTAPSPVELSGIFPIGRYKTWDKTVQCLAVVDSLISLASYRWVLCNQP